MTLFGDTSVRIAAMWPFPQPAVPDGLIEAFEDRGEALPTALQKLCANLSDDEREFLFDGCGGVAEQAWEELSCDAHNAGVSGFICLAQCPVFTANGEGSATFSWGHYRSRRFFGTTAEDVIAQAVAWADGEFATAAKVSA